MVEIYKGRKDPLTLGNLNSKRDIGHAKEYVEGMWRMLQQEKPEDFVLSTGVTYTIRQIVEIACEILGISIRWSGEGVNEIATDIKTGEIIVKVDPKYFRPSEVDLLIGSSDKAKNILGWKPKMGLSDIIAEMIDHQMEK